jgi:hypothetical protein
MLLANSMVSVVYLATPQILQEANPGVPSWAVLALGLGSVFNIVCVIGLFAWKKWGFWGFCASSIVVLCINLSIGIPPVNAIFGLAGVAIIYAVLQIGGKRTGWSQLT